MFITVQFSFYRSSKVTMMGSYNNRRIQQLQMTFTAQNLVGLMEILDLIIYNNYISTLFEIGKSKSKSFKFVIIQTHSIFTLIDQLLYWHLGTITIYMLFLKIVFFFNSAFCPFEKLICNHEHGGYVTSNATKKHQKTQKPPTFPKLRTAKIVTKNHITPTFNLISCS